MSTTTYSGGRMARLLDESGEAWYHVYNRLACDKSSMPLRDQPEAAVQLMRFIDFYTSAYRCEVATYTVMGNHYHLIVRMEPYRKLSREALQEHAQQIYPNTHEGTVVWTDEHWEQFNRRLFSLGELMRNIQQGYARWFNKSFQRRGRFWADRFKSTLLYGEESLVECMQYVDLNPIRAGLVDRPEDYEHGAYARRAKGKTHGLLALAPLLNVDSGASAFEAYHVMLVARGGVASKEGQAEIPEEVLEDVAGAPFGIGRPCDGEVREHLRFFVDGLVLGAQGKVGEWVERLRERGLYRRRRRPIGIKPERGWFALREQRSHFEGG
jgi:REP element-mobilizing transposase RayT